MRRQQQRLAANGYQWLVAAVLVLAIPIPSVAAQPVPGVENDLDPKASTATTDPTAESIRATRPPAKSPSSSQTTRSETAKSDDLAPTVETPGLVVIINASNPTERLSRKGIAKLFLKKIKKWDGWDHPVQPVDHEIDSETRSHFSREVHSMRVRSIQAYWLRKIFSGRGQPPRELRSDQAVIEFVANNPGAIGYVSDAATLNTRVKTLLITD